MIGLALAALVGGLGGSLHCAGMCGPIMIGATVPLTVAGSPTPLDARDSRRATILYNAGRGLSYLLLGFIGGAVGGAVNMLGDARGLSKAAAILSGSILMAWGAMALLRSTRWGAQTLAPYFGVPRPMRRVIANLHARAGSPRLAPAARPLLIGACSGLIPCGWLYAFLTSAAATGSSLQSALLMLFFWLGTLPVMGSLGLVASKLSSRARRVLPVASAVVVVAMGAGVIVWRAAPLAATPSPDAAPVCHGDAHVARVGH
mgnify:CR=1 FL=1